MSSLMVQLNNIK